MTEDEGSDPREIDTVLNEVSGMASRWAAFRKFLCERLRVRLSYFACITAL